MTNIFMLSDSLSEEDRFTASLHYLIECIPEIGQRMVDAILNASGRASSKFTQSKDHPNAGGENQPDFLLECENFDIVCEHKLLSPLGDRQLERYLEMPWHRPSFVALISSGNCDVTEQVLSHARYLHPSSGRHFRWRDIYSVMDSSQVRLGRDFAAYMRSLGMNPLELPNGWGNLFTDRSTSEAFGQQFQRVRDYFGTRGGTCRIDSSRLGFQIGLPVPWLRLLYLFAKPASEVRDLLVNDDVLGARLYVPANAWQAAAFTNSDANVTFGRLRVSAIPRYTLAPWDRDLRLVYEYQTSLGAILSNDANAIREGLCEFAVGAFNHACGLVERLSTANT